MLRRNALRREGMNEWMTNVFEGCRVEWRIWQSIESHRASDWQCLAVTCAELMVWNGHLLTCCRAFVDNHLPSRRSLCSADTNRLVVPTSRLSTVGSRAFPIAGPQTWNDLPEDVKTWHQQNHWPHFVASSRHTCSDDCLRWTGPILACNITESVYY